MKKVLFIFLPGILLCFAFYKNTTIPIPITPAVKASSSGNNSDSPPPGTPILETPQQYNNYIVERQKQLLEYINQVQPTAITNMDVKNKTDEAMAQINRLVREIKAMPPYRGSDALQNAAVALFEFYETAYSEINHKILIHTKDNVKDNAGEEEISILEKKLDTTFQVQQQMFADVNHFVLPTTTMQPRVDYLN